MPTHRNLPARFGDATALSPSGSTVPMSSFAGLATLNYTHLAELDRRFRPLGLRILAFPCNQFAGQESGSETEIRDFANGFGATFPIFAKGDVNGAKAQPVFRYLKAHLTGTLGASIKWNFTKFLVRRNGQPFKRYSPTTPPLRLLDDILMLLADDKAPLSLGQRAE
ncbi:glutathione peroxidase [Saprolegnia diclina VS20]|uniref:Glutathione peroxidase n=1 Tax=Saprolegnia diclina (strain VS20) TaxID=1156394 RepID=T0R982_SAPDV|nr:glutathione peroxidase [Saprolegnia diclina VS20]EQC28708.1 glutathione peroxidase [Saprolegnia diclina VS20]|eukprot:XP_008617900.1 glutathione peroxidase [Saprolegnia diclina VS20]